MGWALVLISWFTNEYNRHFTDTQTYKLVNNFDIKQHVTNCNKLLQKLKSRFKGLVTPDKQKLLNSNTLNNLQIPYMKLLTKVQTDVNSFYFKPQKPNWTTYYNSTFLDNL